MCRGSTAAAAGGGRDSQLPWLFCSSKLAPLNLTSAMKWTYPCPSVWVGRSLKVENALCDEDMQVTQTAMISWQHQVNEHDADSCGFWCRRMQDTLG